MINTVLNFLKTHYKTIFKVALGLFIVYWLLFFLTPKVHLEVDTGMTRGGFLNEWGKIDGHHVANVDVVGDSVGDVVVVVDVLVDELVDELVIVVVDEVEVVVDNVDVAVDELVVDELVGDVVVVVNVVLITGDRDLLQCL